MKNFLIIEPHMNGHHGVYLRRIVRGALERNFQVLIGTFEDNLIHPLFKIILQEFQDVLEIITLPTPAIDYMKDTSTGGLLRRELAYRKLFRQFYNKALRIFQPDFVFLPYLDYCTYAIAVLGSPFGQTHWTGIVMRPAFHYKEMGIIGPNSRLLWYKKILFYRDKHIHINLENINNNLVMKMFCYETEQSENVSFDRLYSFNIKPVIAALNRITQENPLLKTSPKPF